MRYKDIPKRTMNGIHARLKQACIKYGFDNVRFVANKYFKQILESEKLKVEIEEKKQELRDLENQRWERFK